MDRFIKVNLEKNRRIIMISDIHGEKDLLISLLNKVNFNSEDYLFLVGDYVARGYHSIETLRYIMELSKQDNVFITSGNCDLLFNSLYHENESIHNNELSNLYNIFQHFHSLIEEMLNEIGIPVTKDLDFKEVSDQIYANFKEELDFLHDLPKLIETDDFIFVHAGLKDDDYSLETDYDLLRTPDFLSIDHRFKKFVVTGHYPVINYCDKIPKLNSIIDYKKNIICLDGGNDVVPYGQLNALVYDKGNFFNYYVDKLPLYNVEQDYFPYNPNPITINFKTKEVDIIEEKDEFYRCYHKASKQFLDIDKEYIYTRNGVTCANDTTNYNLEVNKGDIVHLIKKYKEVSFVKKSGIIGFIPNRCLGKKYI